LFQTREGKTGSEARFKTFAIKGGENKDGRGNQKAKEDPGEKVGEKNASSSPFRKNHLLIHQKEVEGQKRKRRYVAEREKEKSHPSFWGANGDESRDICVRKGRQIKAPYWRGHG